MSETPVPATPGLPPHGALRKWEIVALVLLTIAGCAAMGWLAVWVDLASAERAFNQQVNSIQRDLAHRFGNNDAVLTSLVGLHHASEGLSTHEFSALSSELLAAYPHIHTIAKIVVLPAADRGAFVEEMRSDGFQLFSVKERTADRHLIRASPRPASVDWPPIPWASPGVNPAS